MQSTVDLSFQTSELAEKLKQACNDALTGYWQIELKNPNNASISKIWYLAIVQGRVVFSGDRKLSWASFIETIEKYISKLRGEQSKQVLNTIQQQNHLLGKIILEMQKSKLLTHDEAIKALQLNILSDMDRYLFNYSGTLNFIAESELVVNTPIQGFDLNNLLTEAAKRREQWSQMQKSLPSFACVLTMEANEVANSSLAPEKKQQLQQMLGKGKTLDQLAYNLAKDPLDIAKIFAPLISKNLVKVTNSNGNEAIIFSDQLEIFIVDDSPTIIQQFSNLVGKWGYKVNYSDDALTAVEKMLKSSPTVIFLDVNMPGATGFELIKLIRRQSKLSAVPLVLLTAEKTVANQWRAQWANCKFLAKPRTSEESKAFPTELRNLLEEINSEVKPS